MELSTDQIQEIKDFATKWHGDQKRKYTGEPYTNHLSRVATITYTATSDIRLWVIAILHDVLEDTQAEWEDVLQLMVNIVGVRQDCMFIVNGVNALTDVYTKPNFPSRNRAWRKTQEARRLATLHPDYQTVKLADLMDNCEDIAKNDPKFAKTFINEARQILRGMTGGDPSLRTELRKLFTHV